MKNLTITIALLLSFQCLLAQNWAPFALGESHHYRSDTGTWIDRTIRIDSVTNNTQGSVWHFPRLLTVLDERHALTNVPHFCQRMMRVQGNGRFQFFDPGNVSMDANANLGDLALVDSSGIATGLVTRIFAGTVLGEADSIKVITLTAGDSLLLSKAHGLVEWPASLGPQRFTLVGLQSLHLGDTLPGFDGFFQFKAGDVFYWAGGGSRRDDTRPTYPPDSWSTAFRMEIISAVRDSAGLNLTVENRNTEDSGTWEVDTVLSTIPDVKTGMIVAGPDEMVHCGAAIADYFFPSAWGFRWPPFCADYLGLQLDLFAAAHYHHRLDTTILSFGQDNRYNYWHNPNPNFPSDTLEEFYWVPERFEIAQGLGFRGSKSEAHGFYASTYYWSLGMVGYVIDGDTVGTLPLPKPKPIPDWSVWPIPANDIVHLKIDTAVGGTIHIVDMAGRIVRGYTFEGEIADLPVSDLRPGMYVLRYTQGQIMFARRITIFR